MAIADGSLGTIRTMAGDLALERGGQPRKIEVPQAPPPTPPAPGAPPKAVAGGPKPANATPQVQGVALPPPTSRQTTEPPKIPLSQKTLEELLPLEEPLGTIRGETIDQTKTMPQQPQQKPQIQQENPPEGEAYKPIQPSPATTSRATPPQAQPTPPPTPRPPTPPARPTEFPSPPPAPTSPGTSPKAVTGDSTTNDALKEEVFPAPDIKKDFTKPPPPGGSAQSPQKEEMMNELPSPPTNLPNAREEKESKKPQEIDTDTEVPTETPEELLGMEESSGDETTPPESAPPARPTEFPPPPPAPASPGTPPRAVVDEPIRTEKSLDENQGKDKTPISRPFIMIGGAILVLLLIAGGIFYYTSRPSEIPPTPQPSPPADEQPEPPQPTFIPPAPLITPDFIQEIIVENFTEETILTALKTLAFNEYPQQSITYLPIRLSQSTPKSASPYLDAPTFFTNLNIKTPPGMLDAIDKQFMLYIYGPPEQEQALCEAGGFTDETCWGPRLGFVLQGPQEEFGVFLSQWATSEKEGGWEKANLYRLILSGAKSMPQGVSYTTAPEYRGLTIESPRTVNIAYINLPISTMTFDFTTIDEFFVFATSKNALFLMLDKIIQE